MVSIKKIISTSGKYSWGNLDFSFVVTCSIFPEYLDFSVTGKNSLSKQTNILYTTNFK